jgi:hypothetical protein
VCKAAVFGRGRACDYREIIIVIRFSFVLLFLIAIGSLNASFRSPDAVISRADLDKPIDPWNIHVSIDIYRSDSAGTWIRCVVLENERFEATAEKQQNQIARQVIPVRYEWELNGRFWVAGFLENRDKTFHTIVSLPDADLASSVLRIVLPRKIGGMDRVWPVVIAIDMSEFDWAHTMEWKRQ